MYFTHWGNKVLNHFNSFRKQNMGGDVCSLEEMLYVSLVAEDLGLACTRILPASLPCEAQNKIFKELVFERQRDRKIKRDYEREGQREVPSIISFLKYQQGLGQSWEPGIQPVELSPATSLGLQWQKAGIEWETHVQLKHKNVGYGYLDQCFYS